MISREIMEAGTKHDFKGNYALLFLLMKYPASWLYGATTVEK